MPRMLVFGKGWLGGKYAQYFKAPISSADITDKRAVTEEIEKHRPEVVINAAGKTGRPNIDWCEDHKEETVSSNITGPLVLYDVCRAKGARLVHLSSGCIYDGVSPQASGFSEEDEPNPVSFYSWTKVAAESVLKIFPVLILRLRMPIDSEPNPRNLITKLAGYKNVIDVENSVTVVDDLLLASEKLIEAGRVGIYNIVNPGPVKHRDILKWYKEKVDPSHTYNLIEVHQLQAMGLAKTGRSNCILNTGKLEKEGIKLQGAKEAIISSLQKYKKHT